MPSSKYPPADPDFEIEPTKWQIQPDASDLESLTKKEVNTWLLSRMARWEDRGYRDESP